MCSEHAPILRPHKEVPWSAPSNSLSSKVLVILFKYCCIGRHNHVITFGSDKLCRLNSVSLRRLVKITAADAESRPCSLYPLCNLSTGHTTWQCNTCLFLQGHAFIQILAQYNLWSFSFPHGYISGERIRIVLCTITPVMEVVISRYRTCLSGQVKWDMFKANNSHPSSAKAESVWSSTSTQSACFHCTVFRYRKDFISNVVKCLSLVWTILNTAS